MYIGFILFPRTPEPNKITMKCIFTNIPEETTFAVFDYDNKKAKSPSHKIPVGDSETDIEIPEDWSNPYHNIRAHGYIVDDAYSPIDRSKTELNFSGELYYLDITREKNPQELNQFDIEAIITGIHGIDILSSRKKFFIALTSLESYFEYLTFGMLVLSGYKTEVEFEDLKNQSSRIDCAISRRNTSFFNNQIEIRPGVENEGQLIEDPQREALKDIFHGIRDMRNKIIHAWSYNDLGKENLSQRFADMGENIGTHLDEDTFYRDAAFQCVRLYARVQYVRSQVIVFNAKQVVRLDREASGY